VEQNPETEPDSSAEQNEDVYKLTDFVPVMVVRSEEDIEAEFLFAIFTFFRNWPAFAISSATFGSDTEKNDRAYHGLAPHKHSH
jgi:hypothetical protein